MYFKAYLLKTKIVGSTLFTKKGLFLAPVIVPLTMVQSTAMAVKLLLFLMCNDFFTGVLASYFEHKKQNKDGFFITSEKLKKTGVKFLLYSLTIITAFFLQEIFKIKTFTLLISDMKFNLVIGVVGFWCIVECYSIFFENFPKMGIDIKNTIRKIVSLSNFLKEKSKDVCK